MTARLPTLHDVASAAGVSRMTASRALRDREGVSAQVRDKIRRIAKDLGYVPNQFGRKPADMRNRAFGLVSAYVHSVYVEEFINGAAATARDAGYEMLVYSVLESEDPVRAGMVDLLRRTTQGVIGILRLRDDFFTALRAARVPVIALECSEDRGYRLRCDNYNGGRAATHHLVDLGHQRIAHIFGPEKSVSSWERKRGYEDVLAECGRPRDPSLIEKSMNSEVSGLVAARRLLALEDPPTAIFAGNDQAALGAIAAAEEVGLRVPEDLSVVGFDDLPLAARAHPPLTTVRQPLEQMGRSAVNTLLAMVAGVQPVSEVITFPTELIVRESTAPPRRKRASRSTRSRARRR